MDFAEKQEFFAEKVRNQLLFSEFLVNKGRVKIKISELMTKERSSDILVEKRPFIPGKVGFFPKM